MPTYKPDGTIDLDTKVPVGASSPGPGRAATPARGYSDSMFADTMGEIPGLQADRGYEHYEPAFRHGWESADRHRGRAWSDVERDLEQDWRGRHADRDWHEHKGAIRHAFERAMHVFEGAKDPDK